MTSAVESIEAPDVPVLDEAGRALLFTEARTGNAFADTPVSDEQLAAIWELTRWAPTSANLQPLRVTFVRTPEGKERLLPLMSEGNRVKTASAPVTAILAVDSRFHEHAPTLLPIRPQMRDALEADEATRSAMAQVNGPLQAGYFILAIRAQGLVAGPMAGFDAAAIDAEFFPDGRWKSLLVINIGHPGENPWFDRLPRLDPADVIRWA
ncbi:nitroreductase [Frankia torreyi]|uniref:Nitroreductase n=1 Tax=Frankia torreyi TaxID=1856 RepID=A0A0D8BAV4_9ACTN|nr:MULTISPECIES: malonic semialdehyde reductase [Frankia]KJE21215.1 nitroreductase [Frankia torreyi]KQC36219.1 NADH dehydrogenase [Frankia sp. ACN1ag]KQM03252.1 nitroreductase [Frankia sp. CpI1-P]